MLMAVESDRLQSMFTFFLVALVIVAPFGFVRLRAILRERHGAPAVDSTPDVSASVEPGPDPGDLSSVIAAIGRVGAELPRGSAETRDVLVPREPTVEGRPSAAAVVDALVADAARRSGLDARWVPGDADGERRLRLSRR